MYPWQSETNMHLPGGAISVAHQFLRCVLHQLAPNGVFMQMFQTHLNGRISRGSITIRCIAGISAVRGLLFRINEDAVLQERRPGSSRFQRAQSDRAFATVTRGNALCRLTIVDLAELIRSELSVPNLVAFLYQVLNKCNQF